MSNETPEEKAFFEEVTKRARENPEAFYQEQVDKWFTFHKEKLEKRLNQSHQPKNFIARELIKFEERYVVKSEHYIKNPNWILKGSREVYEMLDSGVKNPHDPQDLRNWVQVKVDIMLWDWLENWKVGPKSREVSKPIYDSFEDLFPAEHKDKIESAVDILRDDELKVIGEKRNYLGGNNEKAIIRVWVEELQRKGYTQKTGSTGDLAKLLNGFFEDLNISEDGRSLRGGYSTIAERNLARIQNLVKALD